MNPQRRARQLERAALRAAQKAMRRRDSAPLTRDELLNLRVQAAPNWLRLLLVIAGLAFIGAGIALSATATSTVGGTILIVVGLIAVLVGFFGWRATLKGLLEELGDELAAAVINAVGKAPDGL